MSDFDYDVFGTGAPEESSEAVNETPKEVEDKPAKKVSVSPKKVTPKVKAANNEPEKTKVEEQQYNIFDDTPEKTIDNKTEVKETVDSTSYEVFSDNDADTNDESYYSTSDGGYQDEGGSGNRRSRAMDTGEAAGLAVAAVAGAALSRSNKVPKAVKNAINPNYQNEKKAAEEQQFLNARKERQARYEQKAQAYAKSQKKPFYKKWWFWLIIGILLLSMVGACFGGDDSSTSTADTTTAGEVTAATTTTVRTYSMEELVVKEDTADGNWYAYAGEEKALSYTGFAKNDYGLWYVVNGKVDFSKTGTESLNGKEYEISGGKATEKTTTTKPTTSFSQRNALNKANDYLDYTAFSRSGLIKQLEFEGFSNSDATWAVDNCGADWNEQAYKKAKEYLDFSSFSHSGLVDQLEYEGFTSEQAEYGVSKVGL